MGFVPIFKVKKSLLEIVGNWDILSVRRKADLVPDWIKTPRKEDEAEWNKDKCSPGLLN